MPAYEDVRPALSLLRKNAIHVVAVSNSSLAMIKKQPTSAGILDLFDACYSLDEVEKYKSFKDIYLSAAKQEGLKTRKIVMVATQDWDLIGAKKAGLSNAYIKRNEKIYHPYYLQAEFKGSDLSDLIQQIIDHENQED
ncbi:MAG: HAD hydrolase-like protein [Lentimicrobium sp.]|nr:HAD hydrolase-like protein [Lentimicrobium sp.]